MVATVVRGRDGTLHVGGDLTAQMASGDIQIMSHCFLLNGLHGVDDLHLILRDTERMTMKLSDQRKTYIMKPTLQVTFTYKLVK